MQSTAGQDVNHISGSCPPSIEYINLVPVPALIAPAATRDQSHFIILPRPPAGGSWEQNALAIAGPPCLRKLLTSPENEEDDSRTTTTTALMVPV